MLSLFSDLCGTVSFLESFLDLSIKNNLFIPIGFNPFILP